MSPVCTCEKGWGGPRCTVPDSCSGVIDSGGGCCASGLLDASGGCCDGDGSGASPATDSSGNCCPSGFVDACGACGGRALAIDSRGECCSGALDAAGYCCPSGSLDACGVCGGSSEGAAGCPRDPECGDNVCQQEEGPWVKGANRCLEDCPLPTFDCPSGPSWAVRGRTAVCSDRGSCQVGQGRCSCFRGYDGKACSRCEAGWERSPSGACIPVVAPQQQTPALTPVSGGLQQNTTVPPEEASARGSLPTWALAAIIAGSVFLLAAGLAGMWCAFCLPSQAVQGLELYPASNVYGNRATVQSQVT